jgi:dipeptidyl aminopeptidase/acylaminoacyl peptidase
MTVEDLWAVRRVQGPAVDAAGTTAVVPVADVDLERNRSTTRLYRVGLDGDRIDVLTAEEASASEPALSPDGSRVAFVRKEGEEPGQLALLPLDGGEAEVLTRLPLGITDPKWFPDGTRIAFVAWVLADAPTPDGTRELMSAREKDRVKARVTEDRIYRFWDTWLTDGRVPHLFVLDLASRELTDLTPDSRRWFDFMEPQGCYDIAPDGRELVFSADRSLPPHSPTNWDVFAVPATGGEIRNLTERNPADDTRPRYSPDGRWIVYGMQRMLDFYADRVRLVAYDRENDRHRVLTEEWDRSAQEWVFDGEGNGMYLTAENEGRTAVYWMPLETGSPTLVCSGGTYGSLRPLGARGLLTVKNSLSRPPELVRISGRGGDESFVTGFNDGLTDEIAWGEVREMSYPGFEGRPIQAYLVLPPGFDPGRKWPLVEVLHGGPHGITGDQFHFRWNLQLIAAGGYVVLAPNFHGSTSWGQDFAASIHGGWGDRPYYDAMAAVDAVLEKGYVDPARMAAVGASYGGYLVTWIAGNTDRFACIVNHAGVADTLAEFASDVTYGRERAMGGQPWDGLEAIDRMNPIRCAEGFKTPMLVIHGEKDYRVPVHQGLALYNVLKAKGVPARLLYFPDENHWVLKPQNSRLWHQEFRGWLDRWLGGDRGRNESGIPGPGTGT